MTTGGGIEQQAKDTLTLLRQTNVTKPVFVEFSGTPKSGKSTCIDIIAHFFRRVGYKVLAPTEGASKRTPYYLKDDWVAFNTWSASYALMHVLEGLYGSDKYDLAILDRGLFDALAWFELLQMRGEITEEKRDHIHNFLCIDNWRHAIDMVLLFTTDPETSLERENRDKLTSEEGRAMNPQTLEQLNRAYDTVRQRYSDWFSQFKTIETDANTTPRSTATEAAELILSIFQSIAGGQK